jgi:hypothetical protein
MKKKLFVLTLSISMLSALVFGQALAGSATFSGTLDLFDLKQAVLGWAGPPCTAPDFSPILWYYEVHTFKVTVDGTYIFSSNQPSYGADSGWAFNDMTLYDGPFTAGDVLTHCVVGTNLTSPRTIALLAGKTYTIVTFSAYQSGVINDLGQYNVTITGPGDVILLPDPDNRINWDSGLAGPVALYCNDDVLDVWLIDLGSGEGIYQFSFDAWDDTAPDTNTLVKSVGATELWHLTTGEYQLNLAYSPEYGVWKGYAFLFNGCPYDGNGYTNNFDANQ